MATLVAVPIGSAISYFQAIVLGLLQGVTELFPISSLGHTVLFPTLFGWNSLVKAQSQSESFWLAFVVMLHVGSALGLLAYYCASGLKDLIGRGRPAEMMSDVVFHGDPAQGLGFPSGHAAVSAALAAVAAPFLARRWRRCWPTPTSRSWCTPDARTSRCCAGTSRRR